MHRFFLSICWFCPIFPPNGSTDWMQFLEYRSTRTHADGKPPPETGKTQPPAGKGSLWVTTLLCASQIQILQPRRRQSMCNKLVPQWAMSPSTLEPLPRPAANTARMRCWEDRCVKCALKPKNTVSISSHCTKWAQESIPRMQTPTSTGNNPSLRYRGQVSIKSHCTEVGNMKGIQYSYWERDLKEAVLSFHSSVWLRISMLKYQPLKQAARYAIILFTYGRGGYRSFNRAKASKKTLLQSKN